MAAAMWAVAMLVALAEATAWGAVRWAAFVAAPLAAAAAMVMASTALAGTASEMMAIEGMLMAEEKASHSPIHGNRTSFPCHTPTGAHRPTSSIGEG